MGIGGEKRDEEGGARRKRPKNAAPKVAGEGSEVRWKEAPERDEPSRNERKATRGGPDEKLRVMRLTEKNPEVRWTDARRTMAKDKAHAREDSESGW